jgi:uncharacterized RDD family membrane protein YckC
MHILDLIMYFVTAGLLWFIMDIIGGGDYTKELGGVIGATIMVIYTIVYIVLFVIGSYNWIDIFHSFKNFTLDIKL